MNKFFKILFLMLVIGLVRNNAFASDNVLQAIQVNGTKDSYNIILKSDDVAELKKTVQAPNKMILNLKGIRASKTINTIYNNTSSVDSVVVEPTSDDTVKISIQAANVGDAGVHFDTLKTPLGVLDKSAQQNKSADELVLNKPMDSYKPVYDNNNNEEETSISLVGSSVVRHLKNILKNEKASWMITFVLFAIFLISGLKLIKGKDSDIKVGLTQSLKDREIDLYRGLGVGVNQEMAGAPLNPTLNTNQGTTLQQNAAGSNYGLRAYQQGTRSPYATPEIQRPRPAVQPSVPANNANLRPQNQNIAQNLTQNTMPNTNTIQKTAPVGTRPKSSNIDSMKFLESMTKIYEKNGRSDLAQGLKTNMKKAKMKLA